MATQFFRTGQWRSAAPQVRVSRIAPFKSMVAFVVDQVLLFWPPYRYEKDSDCCRSDQPANGQDDTPH